MKELMLLRHAKSDWAVPFNSDRDRPLARRGRDDAKRVGQFLRHPRLQPDLILVSPAARAASTAELAFEAGNWKSKIVEIEQIYGASPDELLNVVQLRGDEAERLMLVGHNPSFEESLSGFIGGGKIRMPTGALALIEWPVRSWIDVTAGTGVLRWMVKPRLLKKVR